jgi:predicted MFS family arabinose efflux permease
VSHEARRRDLDRWIALAVLTIARIAMGFQFQSVGAVSPLLTAHLQLTSVDLGLLVGLFSMPGIIVALPGAMLGARLGDRRLVLIGLALKLGVDAWRAHRAVGVPEV